MVATHGRFAEGIINSFQMILGKQENFSVLCAYAGEEEEALEKVVRKIVMERKADKDLIIITDLFGGSVNNEFMKYLNVPGVYLITGLSLPLLLELYANQERESKEMIRLSIMSAQSNLKFCNELLKERENEEEF